MNLPPADTAADIEVLVVDDVEDNRVAMKALLERPGVKVLGAPSGAVALDLLLRHDVALALLDVQMPEMDGLELAELMRGAERTRAIPIIFVTATPRDALRPFRGYEAGAVDFLYKPVDPRIIESKVGVFVELHAQRRALTQRNLQLQHALELNATMSAVLTHDLRAPLSAITVSAEVVRRAAPPDDAALHKSIGHIRTSSARMARMIAQLLDFSHISSGALRLQCEPADLHAVCRGAAEELQAGQPQARIEVSCTGKLAGTFDPDRMAQVFSNLLGNALEHGHGVGVQVDLDGSDPQSLRFTVSNPGALPDDVRSSLFVAFRGRRAGSGGGLGLGLHIVDQFVRAHGGSVQGESTGGVTRFEVRLPRHAG